MSVKIESTQKSLKRIPLAFCQHFTNISVTDKLYF